MKNLINYLKALWSWGANSQSSDVGYDCRLTRGVLCFLGKLARRIYSFGCSQDILGAPQSLHSSPSGLDVKWKQNPFMRFAVVLTLIFSLGVGNVWGEEIYRNTGEAVTSGAGTTNSGTTAGISDKNGKTAPPCKNDPTVGTAQLKGSFSLSSVGVTTTDCAAGTNCSWTDYGFVWGTSANPSLNNSTGNANSGCTKVQKGTSETATTWDGTLTGSFTVGTTYHYRAYGKNGKAGATYYYSSDATFTPRSVTLNDSWNPALDKYDIYTTVYTASGTPAVKPEDPTKEGYTFAGWYKEEGLINAVNWQDKITENKTYYAKWTINNYTVSWSVNGADWTGAEHGNPSTNAEGGTKPAVIPTAPDGDAVCGGKVFRGWTTNSDYSGSGEGLFMTQSGAPEITENTTFYAVFATSSGGGVTFDHYEKVTTAPDDWTAYKYVIATADDGVVLTGKNGDNNYGAYATMSTTTEMASYEISLDEVSSGVYKVLQNSKYLSLSANANSLYFTDTYTGANETHTNCDWKIWYYSSGGGYVVESTKTYTISGNSGKYRVIQFNSDRFACYQSMTQSPGYLYKRVESGSVTYSDYATTCCQQPVTQLVIDADQTELVKSGTVNFTLTGGNGKDITWSCRDESDVNCDALLTNTSNSGATLTISSPVAATKTYTVKAVQPENDDDAEVVCGKTVTMDITVKAQWTITFKTTDDGSLSTYSTETVTDGDTYTFPDLSDDYTCETNYSFAGWKAVNSDGAPEYAAGSSAKASADKTWYAVWMYSTGTKTITRDKYELVTSSSAAIAEDDVVVIACNSQGVALAQMTASDTYGSPVEVDFATDKSYLTFASGTNVMELKVIWHSGSYDGWAFEDYNNASHYISYSGSGGSLSYLNGFLWMWDIAFTAQNNATISDVEPEYSSYSIQYNSSNSKFAFYSSSQKKVQLYRKNGKVSVEVPAAPTYYVNNEHCTNGATIRANGGQWITSAKDQKVRITVPVTAKNFATSGKQLTASSDNSHFSVSFPSHTIPSDKSEVEVQMTVEYTPEDANVIEEANITITTGTGDGNATKVVSVNGRSLPDEFVIVTQKEGKWQALPANMESGATTYSGVEVTPNGGITAIPAAPYTTIYSAREVASGRYESAGTCMRLVGNNNKCLWANNSSNGTGIQNFAALGNTNGAQYEWLLSTADGEQYTIANPAHPDYATGRQLGIYTLKYGLYKTTDIFYLLPVGCSSQPGNLQITPRRVDAMFSWETNAASVTIDLWTNEAMSEGHQQAVVTSVPYQFTGLTENTDYWYKITPGSDDDCALTGSFSTTGPTIELVEWGENSATIFVDKDEAVDPQIIIAGEVEHGQGSGAAATDIFFSKYFEAQEKAKLLAIYNGTGNAISLADITIVQRANATALSLAKYGKTPGFIQPGEEIILYYPSSVSAIMDCAEAEKSFGTWNDVSEETGSNNLDFGGKGTIRMFRGSKCIDIIGAMASDATAGDMNSASVKPIDGPTKPSFGDDQGFVTDAGDNYKTDEEENDYELSTNRCLLIRKPHVVSGDSAVLNNFGDFKTLGTYTGVDSKTHKGEWAGLQIPNGPVGDQYYYTCEGFKDVGVFDYNKYYREYTQIGQDKYLSDFTRAADGTYTLPIAYMRQYACLNLKFQLTEHNNKTNVLTEQTVQVPIVVKDARNSNDTLFNNIIKADEAPHTPMVSQSIERCKTCNVVVLSTGTLTKATDGATDDVAEVRDVKVYPGGKLIVPKGTHYVINSLSLRRQEDEIASAKIDAGLSSDPSDVSKKGLYIRESNGVYLDVRIDPSNWHYFTLPYDCRVGDIRFSDGTPAKVNNDYLISWYDGAYRAVHKDGGWTDITDDDYVLKKGLGYIVALPGEGLIKRELRFPMANEVISAELANKEVGGLYAYGGDKTDEELRPNHKGWNMIGNPYLYDYTTDIVKSPLATGELIHDPSSPWNGQWVRTGSSARYIVEPIDNGWTGYRQTTISNLKPFMSYFIQIGTTTDGKDNPDTERNITFTKTSKASIARRNMPAAEAEEPMYPVWYGIEMTAPNAEKDNTTLLISDEFTDGYDMMDDLIKMRGSYYQYYPYPVLASRNNEGEMAFNALPDSSASVIGVPLNYYAAQAGTYTIRTDSRFDLEEVKSAMLYDATTNQYNDLLAGDYSFTTAKGDNTNRFKLFVRVERKKAPDVATGTDNILENGKLSLIAIDRTLVLSGLDEAADIYVYDMSGKLMNSDHASGSGGIWRANVSAQGVYFVRVNSQSGQQTLRTIVK
ncbi:MAG: InlB B-repeat-containing protein [Paludibacteraceae bacterium]|nr:InlB B-repeat-containing protein [Paludibacteraceae bacterium]